MFRKRPFYIVLLVLFSLLLLASVLVYALVPSSGTVSGGTTGELPSFSEGDASFEGMTPLSTPASDTTDGTTDDTAGFTRPDASFDPNSSGSGFPVSGDFPTAAASESGFLAVLMALRPYCLYSGGFSLLMIAFCIVMLVLIGKRLRRERAQAASFEEDDDEPQKKRVKLWPGVLCLFLAMVLLFALFSGESSLSSSVQAVETLQSGQAQLGTIETLLTATGMLLEEDGVEVTLPASVDVEAYLVQNGDRVEAGQAVCTVDTASVLSAIALLTQTMDALDEQIAAAADDTIASSVTAKSAGRVKVVYAEAGDAVSERMQEQGALLLLSLDGYMAVQLAVGEDCSREDAVTVRLSDGTELAGRVSDVTDGVATVVLSDVGTRYGDTVTVLSEDGTQLGEGTLYIHSELKITGFTGTVLKVCVAEESVVKAGATLMTLTDTAYAAAYETLLNQRTDYEAELTRLFALYQSGCVYTETAGVVSGVPDDAVFTTLSATDGLSVRLLANAPVEEESGLACYLASVTGVNGNALELLAASQAVTVADYADLGGAAASLTAAGSYTLPDAAALYLYKNGWTTVTAAEIQAGDLLLFAFDPGGTLQFVIVEHTAASVTATPAPSATPAPTATPLPSAGDESEASASPDASSLPSGGGTSGGGGMSFGGSSGNGSTAQVQSYTLLDSTALTVTPQNELHIEATIDELDVLLLAVGQTVEVLPDALGGQSFTGTVSAIGSVGTNEGGNSKFSFTVTLARADTLLVGMNAALYISLGTSEALLIPETALNESTEGVYVYTSYDEKSGELNDPVFVTTGLSDGENVQILTGLAEGDSYYCFYADSVTYDTGE